MRFAFLSVYHPSFSSVVNLLSSPSLPLILPSYCLPLLSFLSLRRDILSTITCMVMEMTIILCSIIPQKIQCGVICFKSFHKSVLSSNNEMTFVPLKQQLELNEKHIHLINKISFHHFRRKKSFCISGKYNFVLRISLFLTTIMAEESLSFVDFPEDVQLCILSFLTPSEIASFSCTSKRFLSLCESDNKLWFSMCDRRWGSNTQIKKWGNGQIQYKLLYRILNRWDNLIGFWRRCGTQGIAPGSGSSSSTPPLIFFEWGKSFITGSRVSPSKLGTYRVIKTPFLWIGISPKGEPVSFLDPDCRFESSGDFVKAATELGVLDSDELVSVSVNFIGNNHMVVEENQTFFSSSSSPPGYYSPEGRKSSFSDLRIEDEDVNGIESTSPGGLPDRLRSEIYQYFANRTSPSGDRASRRQRKKERERLGRRKWGPEHFVKIVNSSPMPSRPLQGLWKGICDDMSLDFFLVAYDDIGGIACRRLGDASEPFSGYSPVFWTSNTTFVESPFSPDEEYIYDSRTHLRPPSAVIHIHENPSYMKNEVVMRFLNINSSYDLVIPGTSVNPRHVEGRIWLYADGTYGFGFLRNNYIIDLKHVALNGCLLDTTDNCL